MKNSRRTWAELAIASGGLLFAAVLLNVINPELRVAQAGPFVQAYDLAITKTDSPDPVIAGNNLTYNIVVTNTGGPTSWIDVSDTLPTGTTFQSLTTSDFTCTTPSVGSTGSISCQRPSMASPSDTRTLSVVVNVDAGTPKNTVISNTATVKPSICTPPCDLNPDNDMSTAQTTVDTQADLSLTKTATPDPVSSGDLLRYTLTVTNNGPSVAQDVMITDTIPSTTSFFAAVPSDGSCTTPPQKGSGTVKCTYPGATLPSQSHSVLIIVRTCDGGSGICTGNLTNTAQTSSSTFDPNASNSTATVTTTVLPVQAPALSGVALLVEMVLLLAAGVWAVTRGRVVRS